MIDIAIPGFRHLRLKHLVLDYNGTIAIDGVLIPGVPEALNDLSAELSIHVVTADTFGAAAAQLAGLPVAMKILESGDQVLAKREYVDRLGADTVIAIGNGRNDRDMLKIATVGIALVQKEGAAAQTIGNADIVCASILEALDLLRHPGRMIATLRS